MVFKISYGHSKDKRPDLKQFLVEMFCVERDAPIIGATRDGNASDKRLNNELLSGISRHMARHSIDSGAFIYVADSALITRDNLVRAEDNNIHFLSRLTATFNEYARAIGQAVAADDDQWTDIGALTKFQLTKKRSGIVNSMPWCSRLPSGQPQNQFRPLYLKMPVSVKLEIYNELN